MLEYMLFFSNRTLSVCLYIIIFLLDETFDVATGDKLTTNQMSAFIIGAGGFGGPRNSSHTVPCIDPPKRKPCASVTQKTSPDQVSEF